MVDDEPDRLTARHCGEAADRTPASAVPIAADDLRCMAAALRASGLAQLAAADEFERRLQTASEPVPTMDDDRRSSTDWITTVQAMEIACRGRDAIESWCRKRIINARKEAGRWVIDPQSLRRHLRSVQ